MASAGAAAATARRVSGLTKLGTRCDGGQCRRSITPRGCSDGPNARTAPLLRSQARMSASSSPCRSRSGAIIAPAPQAPSISMPLSDRRTGQRGVLADDGRALARDPDARLPGRVVRVAAMLPVPSKTDRLGGVGAVRASIERVDATAIVRTEAVDVRHETQRDCVYCTGTNDPLSRDLLRLVRVARRRCVDGAGPCTTRDDAERIPWRSRWSARSDPDRHRLVPVAAEARLRADSHRGPGHAGMPGGGACGFSSGSSSSNVSGSGRFWNCWG